MKIFNKAATLLCALALVGTTACTDEVKYDPTPAYTGENVYFSNTDTPERIRIPVNSSEVNVTLSRVGSEGELTVGIIGSVTNPQGVNMDDVFNVPTQITFPAGETQVEIPVTYSYANVEAEVPFTLSLAVNGEETTPYGDTTATIILISSPWTDPVEFSSTPYEGVMGDPFEPDEIGGKVMYSQSLSDPNKELYIFPGPAYPNLYFDYEVYVDKSVEVPVAGLEPGKHAYKIYMNETDTHFSYNNSNVIYQTPYEWAVGFLAQANGVTNPDQAFVEAAYAQFDLQDAYYVPEDGAFHLYLAAFTYAGTYFGCGETLLMLPGFSHYSISFSIKGSFIDSGDTESLVIKADRSSDLASFSYKIVAGALTEEQVATVADEIKADTDATLYYDESTTILFPFEEEGAYTLVAVGYLDSGSAVYTTSYTFEAESVAKPSDWEKRGVCEYTDDFVASLIGNLGNYTWEVEYEESISTPGFYRLVKPYQAFVTDVNNSMFTYQNGKNYLYIHAEDPTCAYVGESLLGFVINGQGPWIVTSQADGLISDGASVEDVKNYAMNGTLVDGVFTMPAQSAPVAGTIYSNILMIDVAQYGDGWYRGNTSGKMKVDFLLDEQASAPAKAISTRKPTAAGAYALSRKFVPMKANYRNFALKSTDTKIAKHIKVTKF